MGGGRYQYRWKGGGREGGREEKNQGEEMDCACVHLKSMHMCSMCSMGELNKHVLLFADSAGSEYSSEILQCHTSSCVSSLKSMYVVIS